MSVAFRGITGAVEERIQLTAHQQVRVALQRTDIKDHILGAVRSLHKAIVVIRHVRDLVNNGCSRDKRHHTRCCIRAHRKASVLHCMHRDVVLRVSTVSYVLRIHVIHQHRVRPKRMRGVPHCWDLLLHICWGHIKAFRRRVHVNVGVAVDWCDHEGDIGGRGLGHIQHEIHLIALCAQIVTGTGTSTHGDTMQSNQLQHMV